MYICTYAYVYIYIYMYIYMYIYIAQIFRQKSLDSSGCVFETPQEKGIAALMPPSNTHITQPPPPVEDYQVLAMFFLVQHDIKNGYPNDRWGLTMKNCDLMEFKGYNGDTIW